MEALLLCHPNAEGKAAKEQVYVHVHTHERNREKERGTNSLFHQKATPKMTSTNDGLLVGYHHPNPTLLHWGLIVQHKNFGGHTLTITRVYPVPGSAPKL